MIQKSTVFIDKSVNCESVLNFIKYSKENKTDIHSFEIIQNGEVKVKIAPAPYSFEYKQQLYSLSKSFVSTAIGILSDDGKIDVNDRIIDIFPEFCPSEIGENTAKMCVKHLLSMNTGHKDCILGKVRSTAEPVRAFLENEPEYEPGTHFCYNNAATYMLSQIVQKCTDMTVFDFLSERLFKPLEIESVYWDAFEDGRSQGAVGLHASTEDVAKLGVLYLNGGVYNGKRILSEKWVNMATRMHSDNSGNGSPDWTAGYGFQFWINACGGFRGDGAFGQLCIVLPEKNIVFAMEAMTGDMQKEIDTAVELAENLIGESSVTAEDVRACAESYNSVTEYKHMPKFDETHTYNCLPNRFGMTKIRFADRDDRVDLCFSDGCIWQTMSFGKNKFCENRIWIKKLKPTLEQLSGHDKKEHTHFAAYCTWKSDGLHLYMNYLDNPHTDEFLCSFGNTENTIKRVNDAEFAYNETIKYI